MAPVTSAPTASPQPDLVNFEGMSFLDGGSAPPDTVGDVSATQYVQMVNNAIAVFSKSGEILAGPLALSTVWANMAGTDAAGGNHAVQAFELFRLERSERRHRNRAAQMPFADRIKVHA